MRIFFLLILLSSGVQAQVLRPVDKYGNVLAHKEGLATSGSTLRPVDKYGNVLKHREGLIWDEGRKAFIPVDKYGNILYHKDGIGR